MANSSATGGLIAPIAETPPLTDDALDALFQVAVAGITGIVGDMVRPRWQPVPPKQPEPSVDWCAIGITDITPDEGPSIQHVGSLVGQVGEIGRDDFKRHETITLLCTFHGPLGMRYAAKLRDGIGIPQNMEGLKANGIGFVESGPIRTVPEMYNQQWIRRFDLILIFRRKVSRTYPILNILSAEPIYTTDTVLITDNGD